MIRTLVNDLSNSITYVSGGLFVSNGVWKHPRRIIYDYEIIFVLKGSVFIHTGEKDKVIKEGEMLLILPQEEHYGTNEAHEKVSFYWLHFTMDEKQKMIFDSEYALQRYISNGLFNKTFQGFVIKEEAMIVNMDRLKPIIKQLIHYSSTNYYSKRPCDALMELILCELTQQFIENYIYVLEKTEDNIRFNEACDWMRANIYRGINVCNVGSRFGYNSQYFGRRFKEVVGMTPKQYLIKLQVEKAKALLCETNLKVREVGEQVGIQDEKMFMKIFKKSEQMTPTEFRKAYNKTHYNSR